MISDLHFERMKRCISTAKGTIKHGGQVFCKEVKHIEPTIILNPSLDSELMTNEIFGPIMPIITYKKFDEVIDFINDRDKPLAAYYFGKTDSVNCKRMIDETSSGAFMANDCSCTLLVITKASVVSAQVDMAATMDTRASSISPTERDVF